MAQTKDNKKKEPDILEDPWSAMLNVGPKTRSVQTGKETNTEKDKKKKEKKGAGLLPLGPAASTGTTAVETISGMPQIAVRGLVQKGLVGGIAHFFSTGTGMLALTALVAGTSFFSLWDLSRQKEAAIAKRHAANMFNEATSQGSRRAGATGAQTGSDGSLGYLFSANQNGSADAGTPAANGAQGGSDTPAAPQPGSAQQANGGGTGGSSQGGGANVASQAPTAGLASRYGQMSSSVGGGSSMAGGAGMSSGIMRQFDKKSMLAQLPAGGSGSASSGGAASSTAGVGRTAVSGGGGGKGALGQLRFSNGASNSARGAGSGEGASYQATQAFEGAHAIGDPGQQILGTGDQTGATQTDGAGIGSGSPITTPNNSSSSPAATTPSAGSGTDVTPWSGLITTATALITIAGILLLIAGFIRTSDFWGYGAIIKQILAWVACALAAIVTAIGIILMVSYGQMIQGAIFTAVGALTCVLAAIVALSSTPNPSGALTTTATQTGTPAVAQAGATHVPTIAGEVVGHAAIPPPAL